jgi:hypothetical protein
MLLPSLVAVCPGLSLVSFIILFKYYKYHKYIKLLLMLLLLFEVVLTSMRKENRKKPS